MDNDEQRNEPRQRRDTSAHVSAQKLLAQALRGGITRVGLKQQQTACKRQPLLRFDASAPLQSGFHQPIRSPFELLIALVHDDYSINRQTGNTDKPLKSTTLLFFFYICTTVQSRRCLCYLLIIRLCVLYVD